MPPHRSADQLATLESLLSISVADTKVALTEAADLVAKALRADKVDAFIHDPSRDTLVAVGSSTQPLSARQLKHGLDLHPVANGGRMVGVYRDGVTYLSGRVDEDPEELRGVKEILRVRSEIGVPLEVAGRRRGVLLLASLERDLWGPEDARFAEAVARWVGAVLHQAELVEQIERNANAAGRRSAAEELITVLAHDVRNFIHPVDLAMHIVERRAERDGRADDIRDVGRARRGLARLTELVSDILDVARIEHGVLTVEARPVALVSMVKDIAAVLSTPDTPVVVVAREEVLAIVDPARIRQCVENLVANAIKHSPKLAPVNLVVSRVPTSGGPGLARVEVIDQGPGVAPDVLPHIFERFVTSDARKNAGLGLGLFLARQIALMHKGDLTVESKRETMGTRFTLTLPAGDIDA
ncbi:MAG TPA: GAF domain-containing sensor histidine kinase [Labilithrix sp.]|nr:GAF domain-containing sensor histidine kinase [Labilithrix sp.]